MRTIYLTFTSIIICVTFINASRIEEAEREWEDFKLQHTKQYRTQREELIRKKTFLLNREKISKHNELHEQGYVHHKLGMNKYGDLTDEEFSKTMFGVHIVTKRNDRAPKFVAPKVARVPASIDWRKKGAVSEVQDQHPCGSCWAFSAAGALEGQIFLKTGRLVPLSKQNLLDCSRPYGNYGCAAGFPSYAFNYVKNNGGIDSESSYPYEGYESYCRYNGSASASTDYGYMNIEKTERKLKIAVATAGPISVIIDGTPLRFYKSGVSYNRTCSNDIRHLNHAMLVVGYGRARRGGPYWILKNSWGTAFGEQGYFRLAQNRRNHCGIASAATIPIV